MGVIINPRGTSGSGKTEFVRRILSDYGGAKGGHVEPVHREGRERPMAYRLRHPLGGRPLTVLFHYAAPGEKPHPLRYPGWRFRLPCPKPAHSEQTISRGPIRQNCWAGRCAEHLSERCRT
jgi:hypothetical protein